MSEQPPAPEPRTPPPASAPPANPAAAKPPATDRLPPAQVRRHRRGGFQVVWILPIVAALIAGWLVWRNVSREGPHVVITFRTGTGITAGQTKVEYKAVQLGTINAVHLSQDLKGVEVEVNMLSSADRLLTKSARFWVVRPRLASGNISGLDTVLSGSYIEMDPGTPSGARQTRFTGLEDPPAVRSGEPGTAFTLTTQRIGSLGSGSSIFFHDITAGEVLNYDLKPNGDSVTVHIFVRAPFDRFVRADTHFWNASGIAVDLGAQGVQLRVTSLQAALSGGIAFDDARGLDAKRSAPNTVFPLFNDEATARNAGFNTQVKLVTYFDGSVRGLSVGAPVELNGIQIGTVTDVRLLFDPQGGTSRVAVHMQVQPERFMPRDQIHPGDTLAVAQKLVARGMRAQLSTANFLTGQMLVSFAFEPDVPAAQARVEGDEVVLPGIAGGLDSITSNLSTIAQKLRSLPLDQVVQNLDATLHGISTLVNGPALRGTLANVDAAARQFPGVARQLDTTLAQAGRLVASANAGYGDGSEFRRNLERLLQQASDTARSVRLLADYLSVHPEALIRGRTGQASSQ